MVKRIILKAKGFLSKESQKRVLGIIFQQKIYWIGPRTGGQGPQPRRTSLQFSQNGGRHFHVGWLGFETTKGYVTFWYEPLIKRPSVEITLEVTSGDAMVERRCHGRRLTSVGDLTLQVAKLNNVQLKMNYGAKWTHLVQQVAVANDNESSR
jgi:hypothetical protein